MSYGVSEKLHLRPTGIFDDHVYGFLTAIFAWILLCPSILAIALALLLTHIGKKIFQYFANDDPEERWIPCCDDHDLIHFGGNRHQCRNCGVSIVFANNDNLAKTETRDAVSRYFEWVKIVSFLILVMTFYVFHFSIGVVVSASYLDIVINQLV